MCFPLSFVKEGQVVQAATNAPAYSSLFEDEDPERRVGRAQELVNTYYNVATDFFE